MKRWKAWWDWRPQPQQAGTARFRAVRALGGFFTLMVCCTLVARAADSLTVPLVAVISPRRMALSNHITAVGLLNMRSGEPVVAPENLRVRELLVTQGDTVVEGELLFTLDISEIQRDIAAKQLSLEAMRLALSDLQEARELTDERSETEWERALEDYEAVEAAWELRLQEAGERVRLARLALTKYSGYRRWEYDDEDLSEEEYNRLRSELRTATIAYEQAQAERDEALRAAQRRVDDIENAEPEPDSSPMVQQLDIRRAELELAALYEAASSGGQVTAPASGRVVRLDLEPGMRTTSAAQVAISGGEGLLFSAEITAAQRKMISTGDDLELTLSGDSRGSVVTVEDIQPVADQPDTFVLTALLPEDFGEPGRSASGQLTQRSAMYDFCVPLSALYGQEGDYYLLAVREAETTLGTEYLAERLPVALLDKNAGTVAVAGPLDSTARIIVDSDKPVRDGDRIRVNA